MTENLEISILANLVRNDDYLRKVIPFIRRGYFADDQKKVYDAIVSYVNSYNAVPTKNALAIELSDAGHSTQVLDEMYAQEVKSDTDWLTDRTEQWCQDRALEIAIAQSYNIMLGNDDKMDRGAIPKILQEALGVTFDSSIGHDYFEDAEERFKSLSEQIEKFPMDIEVLNEITGGGFEPGSLNMIMASCVSPITKVRVQLNDEDPFVCIISEIPAFIENGFNVKVDSPNGFVDVLEYKVLGQFEEYILTTENGGNLSCNKDHMVKTTMGWQTVETLANLPSMHVNTINGLSMATVYKSGEIIPIVDIMIGHPSHAYWTDGIESHNTGVGKSLVMSHMAAAALSMGHDVLYVTLEMAEKKIGNRIDANLLGIELNDFPDQDVGKLVDRLAKLQSKTAGQLIIKQYPPGSASVNHFRALLNDLKLKKNFSPKIIFIDYLNLMSSSRIKMGNGTYEYVKALAEELRGLAIEFWVPCVSATQTNRCLALDTKVETAKGLKNISDLRVGEMIRGDKGYVEVKKIFEPETQEVYEIELETGEKIECSARHEFPTTKGLMSVSTGLGVGEELIVK